MWASIDDGPAKFYDDVKGTVNLTPTPLASGNHTLQVNYQVVAGSYHGDAVFQGLTLDSGATTFAPPAPAKLIEFVGDSITVGTTTSQNARTAYGWLIGERLGADHTQIAQGGACLVATADGLRGPGAAVHQAQPERRHARLGLLPLPGDAVVINLGTNDVGHGVSSAQFQAAYTSLLRKVRAAYPQAWIFALETFRGRFVPQTQAAVKAAVGGGDSRVSFVDTTGWLGSGDLTRLRPPQRQGPPRHRRPPRTDHLQPAQRRLRGCRAAFDRKAGGVWCVRFQGGGWSRRGASVTDDNAGSVRARARPPDQR